MLKRLSAVHYFINAFLLALAACMLASASEAKPKKSEEISRAELPMAFAIVRGSSPLCEPDCPEWIWAEGKINGDTAKLFKKFLKTIGKRKLPVIIQSPGGDMEAAFAMGRIIRANKLAVAVGKTRFTSCTPRQKGCRIEKQEPFLGVASTANAYCNSACPMILASGTKRLVGPWAFLGVHQVTTITNREKIFYKTTTRIVRGKKIVKKEILRREKAGKLSTTKMSKAYEKKVGNYLDEMGVSKNLLDPIKKTPASDILILTRSDMLAMKLITSLDQADVLTGPNSCKQVPRPPNCRQVPVVEIKQAVPAQPEKIGKAVESQGLAGEMTFILARNGSFSCAPNCPEWIAAEGTITSNTPDKLRKLLDTMDGRKLPVVINSSGGDLLAAMALGRMIRDNELAAAVADTRYQKCQPEDKGCVAPDGAFPAIASDLRGQCASACALFFAGGTKRFVGPNASFTVHEMGLQKLVSAYLTEMGMGQDFMLLMQRGRFGQHHRPNLQSMIQTRLIETSQSADAIVGFLACDTPEPPGNCRIVAK